MADDQGEDSDTQHDRLDRKQDQDEHDDAAEDTSQALSNEQDPKQKRKPMEKRKGDRVEREVTDPVTHLPVIVHDFTAEDLKRTPENGPPAGTEPRSATSGDAKNKKDRQLRDEQSEAQEANEAMEMLFPPPEFAAARDEITQVYKTAITASLGIVTTSLTIIIFVSQAVQRTTDISGMISTSVELAVALGVSAAIILGMQQWTENRIKDVWEDEIWEAERHQGKKLAKSQTAESTQWLNSLLASIWPLVNPDLFIGVADTLEVGPIIN